MNRDEIRAEIPDHWIPMVIVEMLETVTEKFGVQIYEAQRWVNGGGLILNNGTKPWLILSLLHDGDHYKWIQEAVENDHYSLDQGDFDAQEMIHAAFDMWFWHQYAHLMNL